MTKFASMTLQGLKLNVFLGWPQQERQQEQSVTLDVMISFIRPPVACLTDQLSDTCCYDTLTEEIKQVAATQKFRLLEHLGHCLYQTIKDYLTVESTVSINITKKPDITDLTGGVTFSYGDGVSA